MNNILHVVTKANIVTQLHEFFIQLHVNLPNFVFDDSEFIIIYVNEVTGNTNAIFSNICYKFSCMWSLQV